MVIPLAIIAIALAIFSGYLHIVLLVVLLLLCLYYGLKYREDAQKKLREYR